MRISDWSSDVCSSDLRLGGDGGGFCPLRDAERGCRLVLLDPADPLHLLEAEAVALHETASGATPIMLCSVCHRSEERREGKEWVSKFRYRWSPTNSKKKEKTRITDLLQISKRI